MLWGHPWCVGALPSGGDTNGPWTRGSSLGVTAECPPGSAVSAWSGGGCSCARGYCDSMWELSWALAFPLPPFKKQKQKQNETETLRKMLVHRAAEQPGSPSAGTWAFQS